MSAPDSLTRNRVIFAHFDSYSTALVFPRHGKTMLWPDALPEGATPIAAPAEVGPEHAGEPVKQAIVAQLGLNPDDLVHVDAYQQWVQTADGPVRIHLLRFDTFEAPKAAFEPHEGVFKAISELRGHTMSELVLLREVFNLIIGAGGGRA